MQVIFPIETTDNLLQSCSSSRGDCKSAWCTRTSLRACSNSSTTTLSFSLARDHRYHDDLTSPRINRKQSGGQKKECSREEKRKERGSLKTRTRKMSSKMCDSRASVFVALPWQRRRKEDKMQPICRASRKQTQLLQPTASSHRSRTCLTNGEFLSVALLWRRRTEENQIAIVGNTGNRKLMKETNHRISSHARRRSTPARRVKTFLCRRKHHLMCVCVCVWERERERGREAARIDSSRYSSGAGACCMHHSGVVVVVATTIEDDDDGSKVPTDWQWHMDLHMASYCDHRSLSLYKCCGGSSQGFDDDPAYIGMLLVVITQICCCTSAAVKVLMILHT